MKNNMKKFIYCYRKIYALDYIQKELNTMGDEGWELVNVIYQDCFYIAFFKKEI